MPSVYESLDALAHALAALDETVQDIRNTL